MLDFTIQFGDFNATEAIVSAVTEKGKDLLGQMFGAGAVSVTLPKTKAEDLRRFFMQKGFTVEVLLDAPKSASRN